MADVVANLRDFANTAGVGAALLLVGISVFAAVWLPGMIVVLVLHRLGR